MLGAERQHLPSALLSAQVKGFSIDSRTTIADELFFALAQPDYKNNGFNGKFGDSHEFVSVAFERGAVAAVVHADKIENENLRPFRERLIAVDDCIAALQKLAAGVYRSWNKPVVGITGSAGKTTAKILTAAVLETDETRVLSNIKNYNNGLGHPLTVLRLVTEGEFDIAVLEMGMSTPHHEIERLCKITPPDVAVELNVLPVHIEHLGTIERIQAAKAELVENMKPSGTAILNADDFRVRQMRETAKASRVLTFGIKNESDVFATQIRAKQFGATEFRLNMPTGNALVKLQLAGRHNVLNALAAAAVGFCFDLKPEQIAARLSSVAPPAMRGEVLRFAAGFEVVNDSYNSNPDALISMVETLLENGAHAKRKIVVAGEMLELGERAAEVHRETGEKIAASGVEVVFGVRGFARNLVEGAQTNRDIETKFFENSDEAAKAVAATARAGDLILVKGSRGVRMEKIVERLREKFGEAN